MQKPELFISVNQALADTVRTVKPDMLSITLPEDATTGTDDSLRNLLNVLAYENACVPKVLDGATGLAVNAENTVDYLGDDYLTNYVRYADEADKAVADHGDWQRTVHISYGDFTAESYITDIVIQRAMSLFQIAAATGAKPAMDEETVKGVWDVAEAYAPTLREYGVFGPVVAVPDDAPLIDRLQGLMGWQPL